MVEALGQAVYHLVYPTLRNLGIDSAMILCGSCWVLWFFLGKRNLGMDHFLGQLFCPMDFPPTLNLGIGSALSLWGGVGCCGFVLVREIWAWITPWFRYFVL